MADIFDKEKRSAVMAAIKWQNTKPELMVFKYLRSNNVYFQKHYRRAPGSPDVALPRKKRAVFIDGDFWHGRTIDKLKTKRGENDFWTQKINSNIERDKRQRSMLCERGWEILQVWESELSRVSTREVALERVRDFLLRKT